MKRNKMILPLIAGLGLIGLTQIINHYHPLPDFGWGVFIGIGIGLLIVSLRGLYKLA
ncbi:MAG: hypothetical protein R2879_18550 [Saprospiraceae bacterium]